MQEIDLTKRSKLRNTFVVPKNVSLADEVEDELDRLGQGGRWIWTLFIIATLPNILNGFHVSSYVFVGKMPESYWCAIPELNNTCWTHEQMLAITSDSEGPNSCGIINHDYTLLSLMSYEEALNYTLSRPQPPTVACHSRPSGQLQYAMQGSSIVPEWDLVCDKSIWRTLVQVIISLGKCIGASTVGILSDKYGRKKLFAVGCALFAFASVLVLFAPWYWAFLVGRFLLGYAAPAIFNPALIMMTENVAPSHRQWMGIAFNFAYPVGMLYLAAAASILTDWRDLQLALTVPAVLLVVFWYYFKESPRWLLSKGRTEQAHRIVFNTPVDKPLSSDIHVASGHAVDGAQSQPKSAGMFREISGIYRTARLRRTAIICHFGFFTASFSYYVTAINASNLSADQVVYVSATGLVDALAYASGIWLMHYVGRKWGCFWNYALAAVCMLALLVVPQNEQTVLVAIAMIGRMGISSAYAIVALYTTELFPTEVRNSAIGVCAMCAHVGSMMAPFVVDFLGDVAWFIPTTNCGVGLLIAAILLLINPETSQSKLIDHLDDHDESATTKSDGK